MMNYCDKIKYRIFSTGLNDFNIMVDMLLAKVPTREKVLRLVFFGMPPTNKVYVKRCTLLKAKLKARFGKCMPAFSYVAQPSLDSGLVMEVHSYVKEYKDLLIYKEFGTSPYVVLENEDGRFLFAGGFQSDIINRSIAEQSADVFDTIGQLLEQEGFPVNSIVRQWNYIEKITAVEEYCQHYQAFNDARSSFYANTLWQNGYPAATGIGTTHGGILVELDAAVLNAPDRYIVPLDNKLQVAAHSYSPDVLVSVLEKKTTPKFERAKCLDIQNKGFVYVSGTAAIRGENSLANAGFEEQMYATMENIAYLISLENLNSAGVTAAYPPELTMLRIYLKDQSLAKQAQQIMSGYHLPIPVSFLWADICRDELLIEIEGIARY